MPKRLVNAVAVIWGSHLEGTKNCKPFIQNLSGLIGFYSKEKNNIILSVLFTSYYVIIIFYYYVYIFFLKEGF